MPLRIDVPYPTEFRAEHGDSIVLEDGRELFSDGAILDPTMPFYVSLPELPTCVAPPADIQQQLRLQKQFHSRKKSEVGKLFSRMQRALAGDVDQFGMAVRCSVDDATVKRFGLTGDGEQDLQTLQSIYRQHQQALEKIDEALLENRPADEQDRQHAFGEMKRHQADEVFRQQQAARSIQL